MFFCKKSVAVLDIRSSEITAVVGERGVNNTFIIKSKYSREYDGFANGQFLDESSFMAALNEVVKSTLSATRGVKAFYVGVPGEFLTVKRTEKVLSFPSAKKITSVDCDYLADMSVPETTEGYSIIKYSCLYYVLSDKRKLINPVGAVSDSLQGVFSFYLCKKSFVDLISQAFKKYSSVAEIGLVPMPYAEAIYLVPPEQRDECAILFDLGYISSDYSLVCGNGIAYSASYSIGIGHIAAYLMQELEIPFDVALGSLSRVNLNAKETLNGFEEYMYEGKAYKLSIILLRDKIREGLDMICETIEECMQGYSVKNIDSKPILITGEGITMIRGAAEHISNRLVKDVEIITPRVPYYEKPQFSSLLGLLNCALIDAKKHSFFSK